MLKITEEQMAVLGDVVNDAFEERLFTMARRHMAAFVGELPDDALRARIREDCEAGRGFRIHSFAALTKFVGLSLFRTEIYYYRDPRIEDLLRQSPDPERTVAEMFDEVDAYLQREEE